jgi:hypothetical protein
VSADPHPRYVVREITGYSSGIGRSVVTTSVWIADSWYCYRVVKKIRGVPIPGGGRGQGTLDDRRRAADALCAKWNAEHDAWLAAG